MVVAVILEKRTDPTTDTSDRAVSYPSPRSPTITHPGKQYKNMFFSQNTKRGMGGAWQSSPSPVHAMDMFLYEAAAICRGLSQEYLLSSHYGKLQALGSFSDQPTRHKSADTDFRNHLRVLFLKNAALCVLTHFNMRLCDADQVSKYEVIKVIKAQVSVHLGSQGDN